MRFALIERTSPQTGMAAFCPVSGSTVIAKCGTSAFTIGLIARSATATRGGSRKPNGTGHEKPSFRSPGGKLPFMTRWAKGTALIFAPNMA